MSGPAIHGKTLTASDILGAVGDDLSLIRSQDKLTWVDVGRVLGRGDDAAAKYADGTAEMGIVAFTLGEAAWGQRFTGSRDRMLAAAACSGSDRSCHSKLLRAALAMAEAFEDDEEIVAAEVRKNRAVLEDAVASIQAQLAKLGDRR